MAKVKYKKIETVDTTEQRKKQIEEAVKKVKLTKIFNEKAERYTFSKVGDLLNLPNLISVQLDSYNWFITEGLTEVLRDISPIQDYNGNLILEFFGHRLEDKPKYDLEESRDRNTTYSKRLYVNVRLINKETGNIFRGFPNNDRIRNIFNKWCRKSCSKSACKITRMLFCKC